jgi:hypothetical protein
MNLDDIRKLDKDDLLVGAGIALAFAPKPGRELRDEIRDRLQRKPSDGEGTGAGSARGA